MGATTARRRSWGSCLLAVVCSVLLVSASPGGAGSERAALGGLAQGLLAEGVPLVIGWTASILDEVATQVASVFYDTAASGQTTVDRALVTARQAARKAREERGDPSGRCRCCMPARVRRCCSTPSGRSRVRARPWCCGRLPGMVAGYAEHFIG